MTFIKYYLLVGFILTVYNLTKLKKLTFGQMLLIVPLTIPFAPILQIIEIVWAIKRVLK